MSRVERAYDQDPQYEWDRLDRHRTEFAVTMRALGDHLPQPPAAILDIGGGPGRYAIALARQGYEVTLVDLSQACLDLAGEKAEESAVELAGYIHGDARRPPDLASGSADAVLLMGPLYHLLSAPHREEALHEARRLLKPDGLIFAAFLARYNVVRFWARQDPLRMVEQQERYERLLATGVHEAAPEGGGFTDAYFALPTEISPLMEEAGFHTLDLIACEGVISLMEEKVNALSGEAWETWVDLNYRLGKDPTVHGAAEHLLYVGRRR
jgi:S-adenosylmethionine-dependent methyltransferase